MYNSKIKTQKYQTPHQPGKKYIYITLKVTVANSCEKQHDRYFLIQVSRLKSSWVYFNKLWPVWIWTNCVRESIHLRYKNLHNNIPCHSKWIMECQVAKCVLTLPEIYIIKSNWKTHLSPFQDTPIKVLWVCCKVSEILNLFWINMQLNYSRKCYVYFKISLSTF